MSKEELRTKERLSLEFSKIVGSLKEIITVNEGNAKTDGTQQKYLDGLNLKDVIKTITEGSEYSMPSDEIESIAEAILKIQQWLDKEYGTVPAAGSFKPKMENPGETVEEYERGLREKKRWLKGKGGEKA
jgi:hypothetical protein